MGMFKKARDQLAGAGTAPDQVMAQQRALGIDTAALGGPSNAPVADDDPIWEPIDGIAIDEYARIVKLASNQGVTDEAGLATVAEANGLDGETFARAAKGWTDRMGQSMAVGQRFRTHFDAP